MLLICIKLNAILSYAKVLLSKWQHLVLLLQEVRGFPHLDILQSYGPPSVRSSTTLWTTTIEDDQEFLIVPSKKLSFLALD